MSGLPVSACFLHERTDDTKNHQRCTEQDSTHFHDSLLAKLVKLVLRSISFISSGKSFAFNRFQQHLSLGSIKSKFVTTVNYFLTQSVKITSFIDLIYLFANSLSSISRLVNERLLFQGRYEVHFRGEERIQSERHRHVLASSP